MSAGDPGEIETPDGTEGEQEASFDAAKMMGEHALSRGEEQNGDTRITAGGRR